MKRVVLGMLMVVAFGLVLSNCKDKKEAEKKVEEKVMEAEKEHDELASHDIYQCPMKCEKEKTYETKGNCPVCKMALKKQANKESGEATHEEGEEHENEASHDEKEEH